MKLRKDFLYTNDEKVRRTLEIINLFNKKTIVFSESTVFASIIKEKLGNKAVEYHSNMVTEIRDVTTTKTSKKGITTSTTKKVKFGLGRLKQEAISKLKDPNSGVSIIVTAKALDEGFDYDELEVGLITSYTSNPTQNVQRKGRVVRLLERAAYNKLAIIVNFYVIGTQEEKWLKESQKKTIEKYPVESIPQMLKVIENYH
jgi:superfamily II DNA or RNA helicase